MAVTDVDEVKVGRDHLHALDCGRDAHSALGSTRSTSSASPQSAAQRGLRCGVTAAGLFMSVLVASAAAPLRVALMAEDAAAAWIGPLQRALTTEAAMEVRVATARSPSLDDAEVLLVGGGRGAPLGAENVARVRAFLNGKRGLVVLRSSEPLWPDWNGFSRDVLGATDKGDFAGGAAMQVIDLFPHPITAGIRGFETEQPMRRYGEMAADVDVLIEGIVGEGVTPMAWVRRFGGARVVHLAAIDGGSLQDSVAQRLVTQGILWAGRRDVPAAVTTVQRTFMPDAIAGAFAITLPQGPAVCFDPARGGVNYAWGGDFVDLHPRWITKRGEPARLSGAVFYRERDPQPWRDAAGGPADFQFLGYRWEGRWAELRYTVAGREVREQFRPLANGHDGFVRRFTVGQGAPLQLVLGEPGGGAIGVRGAEMRGDRVYFGAQDVGEFTIEIRMAPGDAR